MIEDHFQIARQLRRLSSNLLERAVIHAHNFDLGVTEVRAIEQLFVTGSMTAKELGQSLALTSGSVTALVNRLVQNGLVDRSVDSNDRRKVKITIVPDQIPRLSAPYMLYIPEFLERAKKYSKAERQTVIQFLTDYAEASTTATQKISQVLPDNRSDVKLT